MEKCATITKGLDACAIADGGLMDMESARGLITKVLALDFDRVLTSSPVDESRDSSWMPTAFGGQPRIDALLAFLATVKRELCCVLVVSWNSKAFIQMALEALGLLQFVDNIHDGDVLRSKVAQQQLLYQSAGANCASVAAEQDRLKSKPLIMQDVLDHLGVHGARAVFVDSTAEQLERMPCARYHVQGENGLTQRDMLAICKMLRVMPPTCWGSKPSSKRYVSKSVQPVQGPLQTECQWTAAPPLTTKLDPILESVREAGE